MKIKVKEASYEKVMSKKESLSLKPMRPSIILRLLVRIISRKDLKETGFTYQSVGMDKLGKKEPCLILMNHSAFIDLEIAFKILFPRRFNIVCTYDGFVGKKWLLRRLGCIPTRKFITDFQLVRDMNYAVKNLKDSILMYPEASYSFDGTATPLPDGLGKCIKKLGIPVVMIRTYGAFLRDPLYNSLRIRNVHVSAVVEYLISPSQCKELTVSEINQIVRDKFNFNNFAWQTEQHVKVDEPFRAEGLNKVLYKCPHCNKEGYMETKGTKIFCKSCSKEWELSEFGQLTTEDKEPEFSSVPDWYKWERECVKKEIEDGTYSLDIPVKISILRDTKHIYNVGEGRLVHSKDGFHLTGCDGKLDFKTCPLESYSLYSDYFWYEIGDVICIGNANVLYYCFPMDTKDVVAKTRLATEELYKLSR